MPELRNNFMEICLLIGDSVAEGQVRISIATKAISDLAFDYLKSGGRDMVEEALASVRAPVARHGITKGIANWDAYSESVAKS